MPIRVFGEFGIPFAAVVSTSKVKAIMKSVQLAYTRFLHDEKGTTAIEYSLVAGLVVLGLIAAISNIGGSVQADYEAVKQAWED